MVDNLKASAVVKDKLASVASDIFRKVDQTVQDFGKSKPTDENPISFKVIHKGGALVRKGQETSSPQVHQLTVGEVVTVVDLLGRRAKIISPVEGWVSTETKDGVQIMKPCALQSGAKKAEAFENHFERKFAQMKAKQEDKSQYGSMYDPRADNNRQRDASYSPSPRARSSSGSDRERRRDRDRRDRDKAGGGRDRDRGRGEQTKAAPAPQGSSPQGSSPQGLSGFKLSAPGSSGGPVVTAGPKPASAGVDLFDMGPATHSQPAQAPAAAKTGGDVDLLGFGEPSAASAPQKQDTLFDPFSTTPSAPAQQAAPQQQQQQMQAGAGNDWNAFQGTSTNMPNNFQSQMQQMQPMQQMQQGGQNNMNSMGYAAMMPNAAMGQQSGFGGGFGGAAMGQQMPGAFPGGVGGQPQQFAGGMQPGMQGGAWNAFQGQQSSGMGGMNMGQNMGQFQAAGAGSAGSQNPAFGYGGMGQQGQGQAGNADALMAQAMSGVANMGFEERRAANQSGQRPQQPMNMGGGFR